MNHTKEKCLFKINQWWRTWGHVLGLDDPQGHILQTLALWFMSLALCSQVIDIFNDTNTSIDVLLMPQWRKLLRFIRLPYKAILKYLHLFHIFRQHSFMWNCTTSRCVCQLVTLFAKVHISLHIICTDFFAVCPWNCLWWASPITNTVTAHSQLSEIHN